MKQIKVPYTHTCTIIVTYGDRHMFLEQVVNGVFANGTEKVIIVDNGSADANKKAIHKLELDSEGRVTVLALPENRGSAGGFKAGLEYALTCSGYDYLWLLDDDNRPAEGALAELYNQHGTLSQVVALDRLALVSLRKDWEEHQKVAQGTPINKVFPRRSSFMGFHFLTLPKTLSEFLHVSRVLNQQAIVKSSIEIPFAPYGGLFFHKSVIAKLGYPDERFFLYCDDTEYTYRLTKSGGRLFLVPSSLVYDLQRPWHVLNRGETFFTHLLIADSDLRIYYVTRNQTYLEKHFWTTRLITYTLNKWAFFLLLSLFALRYGKWKRLALIARAVGDGEAGHLGHSENW